MYSGEKTEVREERYLQPPNVMIPKLELFLKPKYAQVRMVSLGGRVRGQRQGSEQPGEVSMPEGLGWQLFR
jgi:hypothetical protein